LFGGLAAAGLVAWVAAGRVSPPGGVVVLDPQGDDVDPDDLLVDLVDGASSADVAALERRLGLQLESLSPFTRDARMYRAHVPADSAAALLRSLAREPLVEVAEHDRFVQLGEPSPVALGEAPFVGAEGFPNDPHYAYQWHLRQIRMPEAWPRSAGAGVVVGVLDTGVGYEDHGPFRRVADLAQTEFVPGYNFVSKDEHANDDHGHGTHVAGTIAQSTHNGIGVAGVAFRAKIMPLKVLSGRGFGSVGDIAAALRFAADRGAKVVNLSLGGAGRSVELAKAVDYAHDKGVVVVCAAGNDGRGRVSHPAAEPKAFAVAATQYDETTTFYSNWGKEIDIAAPGGNTRVDQNGDGKPDGVLQNTLVPGDPSKDDYLMYMGTSMATPHVAGVAALLVAEGVTSPDAVERLLRETARPPKKADGAIGGAAKWVGGRIDDHYGAGIVDAQAALGRVRRDLGGRSLLLALLLGGGLAWYTGRRGRVREPLGAGYWVASVAMASGLFFLPDLGQLSGLSGWWNGMAAQSQGPGIGGQLARIVGTLMALCSRSPLDWDLLLLGPDAHATALWWSAAPPLVAIALGYGAPRLRPWLAGVCVGVAAHLGGQALWPLADVLWLPNALGLDGSWLMVNAAVCLLLGRAVLRR
jgi:serine protease